MSEPDTDQFESESIRRALRALDMEIEWESGGPISAKADPAPRRDPWDEYDDVIDLLRRCLPAE